MPNMSYCMIHNTAQDMSDVIEKLNETPIDELSELERGSLEELYENACEIVGILSEVNW